MKIWKFGKKLFIIAFNVWVNSCTSLHSWLGDKKNLIWIDVCTQCLNSICATCDWLCSSESHNIFKCIVTWRYGARGCEYIEWMDCHLVTSHIKSSKHINYTSHITYTANTMSCFIYHPCTLTRYILMIIFHLGSLYSRRTEKIMEQLTRLSLIIIILNVHFVNLYCTWLESWFK